MGVGGLAQGTIRQKSSQSCLRSLRTRAWLCPNRGTAPTIAIRRQGLAGPESGLHAVTVTSVTPLSAKSCSRTRRSRVERTGLAAITGATEVLLPVPRGFRGQTPFLAVVSQRVEIKGLMVRSNVATSRKKIGKCPLFVLHARKGAGIIAISMEWMGWEAHPDRHAVSRFFGLTGGFRSLHCSLNSGNIVTWIADKPRRGSVAHRSPPQPVPPPRHFLCARVTRPRPKHSASLSTDLNDDPSTSRPVEFAEVDRLPRPQDEASILDQDLLATADEGTLGVCVRIPFRVPETRIGPWHHFIEGEKDIVNHVRIGVLVDRHGGGGMGAEDDDVAVSNARVSNRFLHPCRDVNHLGPASGADTEFPLSYSHRNSPPATRSHTTVFRIPGTPSPDPWHFPLCTNGMAGEQEEPKGSTLNSLRGFGRVCDLGGAEVTTRQYGTLCSLSHSAVMLLVQSEKCRGLGGRVPEDGHSPVRLGITSARPRRFRATGSGRA